MSKIVSFEDVETVMNRMMQVPVLKLIEKREMGHEQNFKNLYDPNLIMDTRHSFFKKPIISINNLQCNRHSGSPGPDLMAIRKAREDQLVQLELRRFEKSLQNARPKFHQYKVCKKNAIANSDDLNFWRGAVPVFNHEFKNDNNENLLPDLNSDRNAQETNHIYDSNIKVTIKDKQIATDNTAENYKLLRKVFRILKEHVQEKKCQREFQIKVQQHMDKRFLRRCLEVWRSYTKKVKKKALKKKEEEEMTHERRIEMFVNAIAKKQEELIKFQKSSKKDVRIKSAPEIPTRSTVLVRQVCVVESPAQNRLKVQQKIIEEQRIKLAKQRQIIEDMQLKEFQKETSKISSKTIEAAKEVLDYCGPTTKRTLLQIMREKGLSEKSEDKPLRVPSPPEFLIRMQLRAEARKERVKKSKDERKKRQEEEKEREELARKIEEEERRELQLKAQREAKRIRQEQEKKKTLQLENERLLLEKINNFYQRLLLKRYIIYPFKNLLEIKRTKLIQATEQYNQTLMKRCFCQWNYFVKCNVQAKLELALSFCNHKLLAKVFCQWKNVVLEMKRNWQVALDFSDMKLQVLVINVWKDCIVEERILRLDKVRVANVHYEKRLLRQSFTRWKSYLEIAEELRECKQRKEELRALVQKVIPDFDPKHHGVAIDF